MHRYRIVAQVSLILSILNLVLAAPIMGQEMHEARGDVTAVSEDVAAVPDAAAPPHPSSSDSSEKPAVAKDVAAWPGAVPPPHPLDLGPVQAPPPPNEWEIFRLWHLQRWLQGLPPPLSPPSSGYYSEMDDHVPPVHPTSQLPAPPRYLEPGVPRLPSSSDNAGSFNRNPPTETSPDSAGFFNRNMKKLKIVTGAVIAGGIIIGGIVGSQIKHKHHDGQDG